MWISQVKRKMGEDLGSERSVCKTQQEEELFTGPSSTGNHHHGFSSSWLKCHGVGGGYYHCHMTDAVQSADKEISTLKKQWRTYLNSGFLYY